MKYSTVLALIAALTPASGVALPHKSSTMEERSSGSSLKMPIYQRNKRNYADPEATKKFIQAQRDHVRARYGSSKVKREVMESMSKRQIIGLSDVGLDSFYVGQVSVGTPSQTFQIILDTGSADFWLADSSCTSSGCSEISLFDSSSSSPFQSSSTPFEIQYGSGAAQGTLASDSVSLAGYTVQSQTLAVVDQLAANTLNYPASGIMGFGFEQLASSGATPFWQVLAEGSTLQSKVFTFQLARDSDASSTSTVAPGGVFTLGQLDSAQYAGSVNYIDLSGNQGYWTIPLQAYSVNGASTSLSSSNTAIVDTGTSLIITPPQVAAAIYQQIPNAKSYGSDGTYAIPCSSNVDLTMTFGGKAYTVNSQDMLNGIVDSSGQYCLGGVLGESLGTGAPDYIIGDTFLKNVFTVFQYSPAAVGFASLVGSSAQTAATSAAAAASAGTTSQAASTPITVGSSTISRQITFASTIQPSTSAGSYNTYSPVGGSGLSTPQALTSVSVSSPSLIPAGEKSSSGSTTPGQSLSRSLIALCSAVALGFYFVF